MSSINSCPFSNEVIGGERDIKTLTFTYAGLGKHGVNVVTDEVVEIDTAKKTVKTKGGKTFQADYLVVAPASTSSGERSRATTRRRARPSRTPGRRDRRPCC